MCRVDCTQARPVAGDPTMHAQSVVGLAVLPSAHTQSIQKTQSVLCFGHQAHHGNLCERMGRENRTRGRRLCLSTESVPGVAISHDAVRKTREQSRVWQKRRENHSSQDGSQENNEAQTYIFGKNRQTACTSATNHKRVGRGEIQISVIRQRIHHPRRLNKFVATRHGRSSHAFHVNFVSRLDSIARSQQSLYISQRHHTCRRFGRTTRIPAEHHLRVGRVTNSRRVVILNLAPVSTDVCAVWVPVWVFHFD